jgi:uncharacterized membrane protein
MVSPITPPMMPDSPPQPHRDEVGPLHALLRAIQKRILSGLILALPIALTFWIVYWLYSTFKAIVLDPTANLVRRVLQDGGFTLDSPWWNVVTPVISIALVLGLLYFLGLLVRSSFARAVDWVMSRVPVVTTIYKALNNVFESLGSQVQNKRFQRVVLVEFPHPGMKALAFVTNSLRDATTDKTILCVCVLTGVMPPAGFTLFVPEESVTDVDWTVNQTLQAILSGGITTPAAIHYAQGLHVPMATGPIIDPHDHPIESPREVTGPVQG